MRLDGAESELTQLDERKVNSFTFFNKTSRVNHSGSLVFCKMRVNGGLPFTSHI